jgi:undecaprenyl-diphosphatase
MANWISVVLLGIIEGVTEFLPISSTGHLLIAQQCLKVHQNELFTVVIQSGAVLAVLPLFRNRLHQFIFNWRDKETQLYAAKILVAFFLTGVGGLVLHKLGFKLPERLGPIAWALLIGGIGFIAVEYFLRGRQLRNEVTWQVVLAVAVGQLIAAVFPGTSRSGATILLALLLGLNRVAAVEFTFLVGIPTMLSAGALEILKSVKAGQTDALGEWPMVALGFAVAAIVSFATVKWLLRFVQTHTFLAFGWYRIVLAGVIWIILYQTAASGRPAPHSWNFRTRQALPTTAVATLVF